MASLNDMQKKAVDHTGSPLLILAGAGSGKTRVITYRIARLIREGTSPENILSVTFTNKAASEMRDRVNSLVPEIYMTENWIGTFHSICMRLLKRHCAEAGLKSGFVIYDRDDQKAVVKEIFKAHDREIKNADIYALLNKISRIKQDNQDIDDLKQWDSLEEHEYAVEYEEILNRRNAVDFDNILTFTVRMLNSNENLRQKYRRQFQHILVDEYQDTNRVQFQLINILAGGKDNICVVGDEDQSIYSWRGATIKNIISFEESFPNTKIIKLEQNYRSTETILDAANAVIKNNVNRKGKRLWTDKAGGEKIQVIQSYNREEEALTITSMIRRGRDKYPLREIAVFVRTNAQTRELEKALRKSSIPYKIVGALKFYDRKEVRDLLAYIKAVNNPLDVINITRIVNTPRRGIGKKSMDEIMRAINMDGYDLFSVCGSPGLSSRVKSKLSPLVEMLKEIKKEADGGAPESALENLLLKTGYKQYLEDEFENPDERWENVLELLNDIREFSEKSENPNFGEYLDEISLLQDIDMLGDSSDAVNVLTLHKAKGLEYEMVIIAGCEEGNTPHKNSVGDLHKLEEERRLFYVGMTRARDKLVLSWSKNTPMFGYGQQQPAARSRYIEEIPSECLKKDVFHTRVKRTVPAKGKKMFRRIKTGTLIEHKTWGKGQVVATKFKFCVVKFSDGSIREIESVSDEFELI